MEFVLWQFLVPFISTRDIHGYLHIIDLSKASSDQTKILPIHWGTIKTEEEDRGRSQIVPQGQDIDQARYDPKK